MKKAISTFLTVALVLGLMVPLAGAATLQTSSSVTVSTSSRGEYLSKSTGGTIGGGYWEYTSNDGIQGTAYCVDFGLSGPSPSKSLPLQPYNRSPHTMGAFANGYPQRSLEQFKELHAGEVRGIENLTEDEYKYATQVAVWATCGQLSVPRTTFTAGRASVVVPTSDAQQIRIYDAIVAILQQASSWTQTLYTGMYLRAEENEDIRGVEVVHRSGLEGAAENGQDGIQKETIGGTEYYTRTLYVSSATSTWIDGYTTKVYSTDTPQGTIFVSENNAPLETEQSGGITYYKVDTSQYREANLNANGIEFYGAFKLCLPVDNTAEEGALTVRAQGGVAQYNLYLAYNSNDAEQSFIVSDPGYTTCDASLPFSWTRTEGDKTTASLQIVKAGAGNAPLEGVSFTLEGSGGTTVTGTTDRDGVILWKDLPADESYTLSEDPSTVPEGYLPIDPVGLTLTAGITNFKTITNSAEHRFVLRKVDAQSKAALKDAVFVFEQIDGSYKTTGTTGFDGVIEFVGDELPYGSYRVYEQGRLDGYCRDDRVETIHWTGEQDVELTWENTRTIGLRVVKYDSQSKISLSGAVFDVYADGAYLTSITTDDAGEARIDGIREGAYIELVEKTAPAGYELDETPQGILIDPYDPALEEDPVLRVPNAPLPGLRIIKRDRLEETPLGGVWFRIWRDGELLGDYETTEQGEVLLENCQPGTYLVQELQGDPEHLTVSIAQEIELKAGDGIKPLVFFNDKYPGVHILKVDSADLKTPIQGAVFQVEAVDGSYGPREFQSDENGEIDLSGLPVGAYVITERSCPGYVVDEAQRIIHLQPNQTEPFVFTNSKQPSLTLTKTSSDGTPLEGVTYSLTRIEDGTRYDDMRTGPDGTITWEGLEPGVFSLVEQETLPDHILDPTEYHVELQPGEDGTIELTNHKRPDLIIHKSDADTGEPVPDTVFLVEAVDSHSIAEVETGPDGTATVEDLLPGVYEVVEKSVPEPYLLDAEPQLVTLYPDQDRDVYFENHRKPTLTILKVDSVTESPIQGAKFQVWYGSNSTTIGELNDLGTYFTDESGQIVLDLLRDGWYKVTELEPAPGFTIREPDTQEFYISGGESKTVTFQNVPLNAIVVEKTDSVTGEALGGATFQLRYLGGASGTGGTVIGQKVTGSNGMAIWTGLEPGTYLVEEVDPADGYSIIQSSETVYLADNGEQSVITVRFENMPDGILLIRKVCATNPSVTLPNAEFKITYANGTLIGDSNGIYRTDENGEIRIEGLSPGKSVIVTETAAPPGYLIDTQSQTIQIREGRTVSLTFSNQPKGALIIQKRDSATGQPLAGAQFRVTTAAGCEVGLDGVIGDSTLTQNGIFTTDSAGEIHITNLAPGAYVISEIKAPTGYVMDAPSTNVVIGENGDTQTVAITNSKAGSLFIDKRDSLTGEPLEGVAFQVTTSTGEYVPDENGYLSSNGIYYTDTDGKIQIDGVVGTLVVTETQTLPGYSIDPASQTQTAVVRPNETTTLRFTNTPSTTLIIEKYIEGTTTPLEGVTFLVTDSSGAVVGPSNGEFITDENGRIVITDLEPGITVTAREVRTVDGFVLDGAPQSILIREGEGQRLTFYNTPVGGVEIIKVNEADPSERIPDVTFEIRRVSNNELIDTATTGRDGRVHVPLEADSYYLVETDCPQDFRLDPTPIYFTVEDGKTTRQTVTNTPFSGVLIHKIDSATGKGIPNVTFLVYDSTQTPIDQITTDQNGYAYLDSLAFSGKLYLRELEAEGYLVDQDLKTVYIKPGETTLVEWENTPITGQIQITKTSADYNPTNGWPAGTPLPGVEFEVYDLANNLVDTIQTDKNGLAISKPLPLGRYKVVESKSIDFYALDPTPIYAEIEFSGQIVRLAVVNQSVRTGVSITKTGFGEVMPGQLLWYDFSGIGNTSTVSLSSFYWRDTLPVEAVRLERVVTGSYNVPGSYKLVYRTNLSGETWRTLADSLSTSENYDLIASPAALGLAANEYVTEIMAVFGVVPANFRQVEAPRIYCTAVSWLQNGQQFSNQADVGGVVEASSISLAPAQAPGLNHSAASGSQDGQWVQAVSRWVTRVYRPSQPLPKTGY